jgi:hypothetical protein
MNTVPASPSFRGTGRPAFDVESLPPPNEPYRGILPFRLLDWRIFLEREEETERLSNLVSLYRGVLVYGQSGAGKSSLLNAGLLPHVLHRGRNPERIRVFPKQGQELLVERIRLRPENSDAGPHDALLPNFLSSRFTSADNDERVPLSCAALLARLREEQTESDATGRPRWMPLLIFDQFEELVTLFEENPRDAERYKSACAARGAIEDMLRELLTCQDLAVKVVFAFRDDYLARLTPLFAQFPNLLDQRVLLLPPPPDAVPRIVRGPFRLADDGKRGLPNNYKN